MTDEPDRAPEREHGGSPSERRRAPRFLLRDVRGTVTWPSASGDVSHEVEVRDISGGGAAVLTGSPPEPGQALRLHLHCQSPAIDPIGATAVSTSEDASGSRVLHLRFDHWVALDSLLAVHRERRMWKRYAVRESRAGLTWIDGGSERTTVGVLINISGGGAAFASEVLPPADGTAWLRLEAGARTGGGSEAVECQLVAISEDPSGRRIAHLRFLDPCPMDLFELAVHGSG